MTNTGRCRHECLYTAESKTYANRPVPRAVVSRFQYHACSRFRRGRCGVVSIPSKALLSTFQLSMSATTDSAKEKIEANRDTLEELAESDLPCSEIAQAALEVIEE